jgi:hypothetical protein
MKMNGEVREVKNYTLFTQIDHDKSSGMANQGVGSAQGTEQSAVIQAGTHHPANISVPTQAAEQPVTHATQSVGPEDVGVTIHNARSKAQNQPFSIDIVPIKPGI